MQEEQVAGLMPGVELHQRLAAVAEIPAGADALVMVLGAALVVLFVLLLTDVLGVTSIFIFGRRAR
jgi:hypothetical protein